MFNSIYTYLAILLAAADGLLVIMATSHAVLKKRETRTVIGWVGLIWFSPFIGAILYFLIGINRIERRGEEILDGLKESACDAARQAIQGRQFDEIPFDYDNNLANVGRALTGFDLLP